MKITQPVAFQPVTITLETHEEAVLFWDLCSCNAPKGMGKLTKLPVEARELAGDLSEWFSNEAHL